MKNSVALIGRVGLDPEVRMIGETKLAKFSLATSKKFKDKKTTEMKEETQWHNISIWGTLAEVVEKFVHKGKLVSVSGEIRYSKTEKDGVTRYFTDIVCGELILLPSSDKEAAKPATVPATAAEEDDLPY